MSCMWRQVVLRIPAKCLGMFGSEEWYRFTDEHKHVLRWDPGCFAPALCSSYYGHYLHYILEDHPARPWESDDRCVRPLTLMEMKEYLPAFQTLFPKFRMSDMYYVHYCAYTWYDGTDAPHLY